jgi:hypothetical protein
LTGRVENKAVIVTGAASGAHNARQKRRGKKRAGQLTGPLTTDVTITSFLSARGEADYRVPRQESNRADQ